MEFEWDEAKRRSNIAEHGFDFLDVWQLFAGDHVKRVARLGSSGEPRLLAIGFVQGIEATAIFTMRDASARVISLRKARSDERKQLQALFDRGTEAADS